jgi:hypothetical protein
MTLRFDDLRGVAAATLAEPHALQCGGKRGSFRVSVYMSTFHVNPINTFDTRHYARI